MQISKRVLLFLCFIQYTLYTVALFGLLYKYNWDYAIIISININLIVTNNRNFYVFSLFLSIFDGKWEIF